MEVVVDDESGTPTAFAMPVRIGAGDSARLPTAYTRFGSPAGGLSVRFVKDGRRVASADLDALNPNNPPRRFFADEVAVLALGKPQGVELVPGLPGYNGRRVASGSNPTAGAVEVVRLQGIDGNLLPGRALGYDAFDAVVVDTNDRALDVGAGRSGRRAAAVGGAGWARRRRRRCQLAGRAGQRARPDAARGAHGHDPDQRRPHDRVVRRATNQLAVDPQGLTIARLEEDKARPAKVLCSTSTTPIVVRGAYGFGRVTVLALDVDQEPFAGWADRGLFWVKAIDLHPIGSTAGGSSQGRFTQTTVDDLSGRLREALEQFPGVKLIPFGWVAFFIFLYILLIGPGDYLFLRKVAKRMELTWITFPAIVVVVSALAYWGAYRAKGTDLRVNQVDVVDVDVPAKLVRGASFVNVFSPENRDYDVAIVPKPVQGGGEMPVGNRDSRELVRRARHGAAGHGRRRPGAWVRVGAVSLRARGSRRAAGGSAHPDLEHQGIHRAAGSRRSMEPSRSSSRT